MSFWDDPVFAGTTQPISSAIPDTTLKQSVGKIELTSDQRQSHNEEPPKFTSWDGFWADPVFANVAGREAPLPEGETREFWKYEVDESVSLSSLFPDLSPTAFRSVGFRKSAIEWWSKPILDKPAGLYLRTEIEFNGLLDEVFEVFKQFLGNEAKPTLRISAYLGVTQVPDGTYASDGLTFEGSLLGLSSQMLPGLDLVTILSVGVQVNVGKTNTTTEIESLVAPAKSEDVSCAILGELHVFFPGLTGPLLLAYKASLGETFLRLDMTIPGDGKWRNPLGVESLLLEEAKFSINIPLPKTAKSSDDTVLAASKHDMAALAPTTEPQEQISLLPGGVTAAQLAASPSFTVSAKWKTSSMGVVKLTGAIYKQYPDASYIQQTLEKVTWSDIKKLFSDIHGEDLATSDHEITCEKLTIRISKAQVLLEGSLSIDGRYLAKATIAITSAGILIRADIHEFSIDDGYVTIHDASLTLMVGKAATTGSPEGKEKQPATAQKGWYGGLEVAGRITIKEGVSKPMDIRVIFAGGKQNGEMFWVLCGSMDSDISLRDIVSSIDEGSELDVRLKSVCVVASNTDGSRCHLNTNGYTVRAGFYLWATMEQVPCIKVGGKVKEPAAGDTTQLSIGWTKGSKLPNVSIFLPKSLKIDVGPRFRSNRFELQIGTDRSLRFVGGFQVRIGDNNEWLQFDLATEIKALEVAGELVFKGHMNNPFGLSEQITIGPKLALGVKFSWPVLMTTGLPTGLGMLGSFYLGEISTANAYDMALYVCENPKDMLIKVHAPSMDYYKLIQFVGAIMKSDVPATDMKILQLKDVDIYASLGVAFAGDYYPAGMRFKGKIIVFDHEAGMDCSLTTEGLRLKAWLQTIELGPLSIGGTATLPDRPGVTFALLDLELSMKTQKFILNGFVKIFSLSASIDLHIQLMPDPAFYFNFELLWSDLLSIKAKAFMVSKGEEKSLSRKLANADWTIDVGIELHIIQRIVETIRKALKEFHDAVEAKIAAAHGAVAAAEAKYKAGIEEAQKTLRAKRSEYDQRHHALDLKLAALEREAESGMSARKKDIENAKINETNATQEARLERDRKLYEKENEVNTKRKDYEYQESKGNHDKNTALSARELRKQDFYAKFGEADASLQRALNDLSSANRSVDSIRGEIDHVEWQLNNLGGKWWRAPDLGIQAGALYAALGTAKAGLAIAEVSVQSIKNVMNSGPFESMKRMWLDASEVFETVKRMAAAAVQEAYNQLKNAEGLLTAAKFALEGDFEKAKQQAKGVVDRAQESYDIYKEAQRIEGKKLQIQLEQLKESVEATAVTTAEAALEVAKNNNIAFKAAQAGLDAVDTINDAVYSTLDAMIRAAGTICDIRVARLTGTLTANKQEQKPFKIYLEGTLMSDEFKLNLDFTPGQTGKFLKDVSSEALALITPGV